MSKTTTPLVPASPEARAQGCLCVGATHSTRTRDDARRDQRLVMTTTTIYADCPLHGHLVEQYP